MAQSEEPMYWFVMRDLKRPNAKEPAYKQLGELSIEVFTPLKWHLSIKKGKREREKIPFIQDLLFVHDTQNIWIPSWRESRLCNTVIRKGKVIVAP